MLGGADNPNGELLSYIIGADMSGMQAHQSHRRSGSPTHQTGRENIRYNTFVPSGVSCRRMRSAVTIGCSVPDVKAVH